MGPRDTRLAPQGEYNKVCMLTSFYVVWNLDMVGFRVHSKVELI